MPDRGSTIERLLAQARGGDVAARDELFARCRPFLGLVAQAQIETWLRTKVDASDLVQETFLEAHRGFVQFRGATEAEWLAWLRRILEHNAADFVRRFRGTEKRRSCREVPLPDSSGPADCVESPSAEAMRRESELQLAAALAELAPDHREVIVLRNLQRLPFDQVAERMLRSRPAVQMLWFRAMHKLQEILADSVDGRL
jgi:RNA polymerase sigma-70 factor (ECF subfamily)